MKPVRATQHGKATDASAVLQENQILKAQIDELKNVIVNLCVTQQSPINALFSSPSTQPAACEPKKKQVVERATTPNLTAKPRAPYQH